MKGPATLRGMHMATVDPKGRLKIPTAFKTELEAYGPDFFVTSLDGQSAQVYPFPVWREMEEKLAALPSTHKPKKKFLDRANYFGLQVRIDGQGRILVPTQLRDSAAVRGEVAVIGQLDHLDVWNNERFREQQIEGNQLTDADMDELSKLGI
jgi:MraZ protein